MLYVIRLKLTGLAHRVIERCGVEVGASSAELARALSQISASAWAAAEQARSGAVVHHDDLERLASRVDEILEAVPSVTPPRPARTRQRVRSAHGSAVTIRDSHAARQDVVSGRSGRS